MHDTINVQMKKLAQRSLAKDARNVRLVSNLCVKTFQRNYRLLAKDEKLQINII
jgi:hypothetical protein